MIKSMFVVVAAVCAGCATVPAPQGQVASSEAAIRGAREVGAESVPQASLHLKLSEEQLAKAKAAMQEGDNASADLLLQRASADAELALALTREATAAAEATRILAQVQQIRGGK
jgi:hypothetical protein